LLYGYNSTNTDVLWDDPQRNRLADCISGTAVVAINPSAPLQDMLAASLPLPAVAELLAFCGLDRADILPVRRVVESWRWQGVQQLTFALVRHEWYAQADEEEAADAAALRVDREQQLLLTVPEGLAGRYAQFTCFTCFTRTRAQMLSDVLGLFEWDLDNAVCESALIKRKKYC
jgi:hypothetical protein